MDRLRARNGYLRWSLCWNSAPRPPLPRGTEESSEQEGRNSKQLPQRREEVEDRDSPEDRGQEGNFDRGKEGLGTAPEEKDDHCPRKVRRCYE